MTSIAMRSLAERAKEADVHQRTLRRLIEKGEGPRVTVIGKQIKIREDHWRAWLRKRGHDRLKEPVTLGSRWPRAEVPPAAE
jgi:hypothetical protein